MDELGTVATTGSSGFVGRALTRMLRERNVPAIEIGRGELAEPQLGGIDVVIHMAGLAHRAGTEAEFDEVNNRLTQRLLDAAIAQGVKRFVFVSSIYAEFGDTPYGVSKRDAEHAIAARSHEIEAVIVRPPLVYGREAKANFGRLLKLCDSPLPLPLGAVDNRRSFVGLTNLCDALLFVAAHPETPGQTFTVTDGEPISLAEAARSIRKALGRPARLFGVPAPLLRAGLAVLGQGHRAKQLIDDLVVDGSAIRSLGWRPPFENMDARELRPPSS